MTDLDLGSYHGWLYKVASNLLPGGYSDQNLEDLVQEGRIAMWRALDTLPEDFQAIPMWLTNAAHLRMKNVATGSGQPFGHQAVRGERPVEVTSNLEEWTDPDDAVPHAWLPELSDPALWDAIRECSPVAQQYIFLRFWCGLTVPKGPLKAQPAHIQLLLRDWPVVRNKFVWHRAKARLRNDPRVRALAGIPESPAVLPRSRTPKTREQHD